PETTALGAAFLAGLTLGVWDGEADLEHYWTPSARYEPQMRASERERLYSGWRQAVGQARAGGAS
ncbi:MAG: glycerol kinase, partial [Chloroflexi bacterium]|nr:glycerol kinase [Chloroflexota bacterium]